MAQKPAGCSARVALSSAPLNGLLEGSGAQYWRTYQTDEIETLAGEPEGYDSAAYRRDLIRLRSRIRNNFHTFPRTELVAQFFSGTDLLTPTTLFPNATIVALDNHAFLPHRYLRGERLLPIRPLNVGAFEGDRPYRRSGEVAEDKFMAPRLLGALVYQGVRIREVTVFSPKGRNALVKSPFDPPNVDRFPVPRLSAPVHGIISFDMGPETAIRHYVHLQVGIPTDRPVFKHETFWWMDWLEEKKVEAFLAKAAFGALQPGKLSMFRRQILTWLRASKGFLVEGLNLPDPAIGNGYEFSGNNRYPRARSRFYECPFGYGDRVKVTRFSH